MIGHCQEEKDQAEPDGDQDHALVQRRRLVRRRPVDEEIRGHRQPLFSQRDDRLVNALRAPRLVHKDGDDDDHRRRKRQDHRHDRDQPCHVFDFEHLFHFRLVW